MIECIYCRREFKRGNTGNEVRYSHPQPALQCPGSHSFFRYKNENNKKVIVYATIYSNDYQMWIAKKANIVRLSNIKDGSIVMELPFAIIEVHDNTIFELYKLMNRLEKLQAFI